MAAVPSYVYALNAQYANLSHMIVLIHHVIDATILLANVHAAHASTAWLNSALGVVALSVRFATCHGTNVHAARNARDQSLIVLAAKSADSLKSTGSADVVKIVTIHHARVVRNAVNPYVTAATVMQIATVGHATHASKHPVFVTNAPVA